MAAKLKSSQWSDFSQRFVRIHGLPNEVELRLYRKNDGRRVRSDFAVKRKAVNRANVARLNGSDHISDLLADAKTLLSTDIDARGFEIRLYSAEGDRIYGNTHLKNIRNLEPASQTENEPLEVFLDLLDEVGIDDISIRQAGSLYMRLREIIGGEELDNKLRVALNP